VNEYERSGSNSMNTPFKGIPSPVASKTIKVSKCPPGLGSTVMRSGAVLVPIGLRKWVRGSGAGSRDACTHHVRWGIEDAGDRQLTQFGPRVAHFPVIRGRPGRYDRQMEWKGIRRLFNTMIRSYYFPNKLRLRALRLMGVKAGRGEIRAGVVISGPNLTLGTGVFINAGTSLLNQGGIILEDHVAIAPEALLITTGHEIGPTRRRQGKLIREPISVGAGSWIGARAVVLPGVTIGPGCVIAAGALVSRDCSPNGLYVGIPAKRVRDLPG
jgi:maltose O-acetyltransferase